MKTFRQSSNRLGFTLLETLTAVAILSTVAAGGIVAFTNVTKVAESTKLGHDVALINRSIRTYMANGGKFVAADLASPDAILAKLKRRATQESGLQLAGLREGMIDSRLASKLQTAGEAASGEERARLVGGPASPRFVIESSGDPGVSRFVMDQDLAAVDFGTEERSGTNKLASKDPWVWDYDSEAVSVQRPDFAPEATSDTAIESATVSGNALPSIPLCFRSAGIVFLSSGTTSLSRSRTRIHAILLRSITQSMAVRLWPTPAERSR